MVCLFMKLTKLFVGIRPKCYFKAVVVVVELGFIAAGGLASNVQAASSFLLSLAIVVSRLAGTKQRLSKISGIRM